MLLTQQVCIQPQLSLHLFRQAPRRLGALLPYSPTRQRTAFLLDGFRRCDPEDDRAGDAGTDRYRVEANCGRPSTISLTAFFPWELERRVILYLCAVEHLRMGLIGQDRVSTGPIT